MNGFGHGELALDILDGFGGLVQRDARQKVERHGDGREQPGVIDRERRGGWSGTGDRGERDGVFSGGWDQVGILESIRRDAQYLGAASMTT